MIENRCQLACKEEALEGTAETLAGADVLLVGNPKFNQKTESGKRQFVSASLSQFAAVPGARSGVMEFDVELKGSGSAGTAPALGKLLKCCKMGETVVASPASVTYLPISTTGGSPAVDKSMTLAMYVDGVIKKIWGARGTFTLKLEKGKPGMFHFVFTGADWSVTDGAMLSTGVSYETSLPVPFMAASFTIDSYAALLGTLDFNINNAVALRPDVNAASGHKSAVITGREPSMSFDPEMVTVAAYDFYGKLRSGNQGALSTVLGLVAGNICTISAPKVQYVDIKDAPKSGISGLGIDCQLNRNSGDDELSIVFT